MIRLVAIFVLLLVVGLTPSVSAQSGSTLQQQIEAVSCSYTTIETGFGVVHDSNCPVFAPTIERINSNNGRPIITGIYDAVHAVGFRVRVGDVWYVLGKSSELTTSGNVWTLNLSNLEEALRLGNHDIIVEMEGDDGEVRHVKSVITISSTVVLQGKTDSDSASEVDDKDEHSEGSKEEESPLVSKPSETPDTDNQADTKRVSLIPLAITLGASAAITWFLLVARKKSE